MFRMFRKDKKRNKQNKKNYNKVKKDFPKLIGDIKERCISDDGIESFTYSVDFSENTSEGNSNKLTNDIFDKIDLNEFKRGLNQLHLCGLASTPLVDTKPVYFGLQATKIECEISKEFMVLLLKK